MTWEPSLTVYISVYQCPVDLPLLSLSLSLSTNDLRAFPCILSLCLLMAWEPSITFYLSVYQSPESIPLPYISLSIWHDWGRHCFCPFLSHWKTTCLSVVLCFSLWARACLFSCAFSLVSAWHSFALTSPSFTQSHLLVHDIPLY